MSRSAQPCPVAVALRMLDEGYQPIHKAVLEQDAELIVSLIRHGANVNSPSDKMLMAPLHMASVLGNETLAKLLLDNVRIAYELWI